MKYIHLNYISYILFACTGLFAQKPPVYTNNLIHLTDTISTAHNTVTATSYQNGNCNFVYAGGDGGIINAFSINVKGKLTAIGVYELANKKGPARGLVTSNIAGNNFLFVGNKGANSVEVFKISKTGTLKRVFILEDTAETYLGTVITLEVIHTKTAAYLFVGGLESTPGLSCFKISKKGKLSHIQSIADNEAIHTDGIIGMYTHKINDEIFLTTGGFQDNGISSFQVFDDGTFKNVDNLTDNTIDRFLTGTYPISGVTLNDNHYIVVGHRHHKYYKRIEFIKKKDFIYHGDGVSVFKISDEGKILEQSVYINDENTLLAGHTRIEILKINEQEAYVAVGTKDDKSIQFLKLSDKGVLQPINSLEVHYPIYYGLTSLKIKDDYFFVAGSVDQSVKKIFAYNIRKNTNEASSKQKALRHIVCFTYKKEITKIQINNAVADFVALKNKISVIKDLEWGINNSTEGHNKGFTHCFNLTFNNKEALQKYLNHPSHLELIEKVKPILKNVFVFDYWVE